MIFTWLKYTCTRVSLELGRGVIQIHPLEHGNQGYHCKRDVYDKESLISHFTEFPSRQWKEKTHADHCLNVCAVQFRHALLGQINVERSRSHHNTSTPPSKILRDNLVQSMCTHYDTRWSNKILSEQMSFLTPNARWRARWQ
jgi:hypothetical protein